MSNSNDQTTMNVSLQSPMINVGLDSIAVDLTQLSVQDIPFLTHVNIRGDSDNIAFISGVESVTGMQPPTDANTFVKQGERVLCWTGPDEWLLIAEQGVGDALVTDLRKALIGQFHAVTEVTGGNAVLEVGGPLARELLAKASTLDFHPSVFKVGDCAQSTFAHAGMMIYQLDDLPTYRLVVRRSFSDYIGAFIHDACREYSE